MTWRPKFSLRTLVVFLLLVTSGMGLWWHWEPWDVEVTLAPTSEAVWRSDLSPDSSEVMVRTSADPPAVYELRTGKLVRHMPDGFVTISDDWTRMLLVGESGPVIRDLRSGEDRPLYTEVSPPAFSGWFSHDGRMVVIWTTGDTTVWEVESGRPLLQLGGRPTCHVSPAGRFVFALSDAGDKPYPTHTLYDGRTGQFIRTFAGSVRSFLDADRMAVIYLVKEKDLVLLNTDGWSIHTRFGDGDFGGVTPDGRHIIVDRSPGGQADLCELETGEVFGSFRPHPSNLGTVSFSGQRPVAITTGYSYLTGDMEKGREPTYHGTDTVARIWDLRTLGCVAELDHSPHHVWEADFLPGDKRVLTAGNGVRIWERRRPEWWWGVFYLPEMWLTAVFAGMFVWSVVRDRRSLKAQSEPTE